MIEIGGANPFLGIMPRENIDRLAQRAPGLAQLAKNTKLSGGVLALPGLSGQFTALHNSSFAMLTDLTDDDLTAVTKPATAPVKKTTFSTEQDKWKAKPASWLKINAFAFETHIDSVTNEREIAEREWLEDDGNIVVDEIRWTSFGLVISGHFDSAQQFAVDSGESYDFSGPIFQFVFSADPTSENGGPKTAITLNDYTYPTDSAIARTFPTLPDATVPLFWKPVGSTKPARAYAEWRCASYEGPVWTKDGFEPTTNTSYDLEGSGSGKFKIVIDLNYAEKRQLFHHFVRSFVRTDGVAPDEEEFEGPISDESDVVDVSPGEILTLNMTRVSPYMNRLYRSDASSGRYRLVDDVDADTWTDEGEGVKDEGIPPYGNYLKNTGEDTPNAKSLFLGRKLHPAGHGVCYTNNATTNEHLAWHSDTGLLHVWPAENTVPITRDEDILHCEVMGDTEYFFTESKVYGVYGNNPAGKAAGLITDSYPMLNKLSLCRWGQRLFYLTNDGLAALSGNSIQIVTAELYTRTEWMAYWESAGRIEDVRAVAAEGAVFLYDPNAATKKLRIEVDAPGTPASEWSGSLNYTTKEITFSGTPEWTSGNFVSDRQTIYDFIQVLSTAGLTGEATLTVARDNGSSGSQTLQIGKVTAINNTAHSAVWGFKLATAIVPINRLRVFERVILPMESEIRLTSQNVELWENIWVKPVDQVRLWAGYLTSRGTSTAYIDFYGKSDVSPIKTVTISSGSGAAFDLSDMAVRDLYRIVVRADAIAPFTPTHFDELTLYARRVVQSAPTVTMTHDAGMPPWLLQQREFGKPVYAKSARVHTTSTVTMSGYFDGDMTSAAFTQQFDATDGEIRLSASDPAKALSVRFSGNDPVQQFTIYGKEIGGVPDGGIRLGPTDSWLGNLFKFPDRGTWAWASVGAQDYTSTTLKLYADLSGSTSLSLAITDGKGVFLSRSLAEASIWEVGVEGEPDSLILMPRTRIPVAGKDLILTADDTGIPQWGYGRFEFEGGNELVSGRVYAESYPVTLNLYKDAATSASLQVIISDNKEFLISGMGRFSALDLDFGGTNDYKVNEIRLFGRRVLTVENNGLIVRNVDNRQGMRGLIVEFPTSGSFAVARVVASGYSGLSMDLKSGGVTRQTVSLSSNADFKLLDTLPNAREWTVDLYGADVEVYELHLIGRMEHEIKKGFLRITRESDPFTWLAHDVTSATPWQPEWLRLRASAYPVKVRFYCDGIANKQAEVLATDGDAMRLPEMDKARGWRIDAIAAESIVIDELAVATSARSMQS